MTNGDRADFIIASVLEAANKHEDCTKNALDGNHNTVYMAAMVSLMRRSADLLEGTLTKAIGEDNYKFIAKMVDITVSSTVSSSMTTFKVGDLDG